MSMWSPTQLAPWVAALKRGDVCAAPAEGVYGYVADPFNLTALQTVLETKNRAPTKGYIVLVAHTEQLKQLCPELPESCHQAIATYWQEGQAPTTLILPASPTLPPLLTGGMPTIAVRKPNPAYMQEYLEAAGQPIVSTSLNISGDPAATAADQLPKGVPALSLAEPLNGTPSRIYNPVAGVWLR